MPIIPPKDQETLRDIFQQRLQDDVSITYFTQHDSKLMVPGLECEYCKETHDLLEELTTLSDKLHLSVKDFVHDEEEAKQLGIEYIPAFVMQGHSKGKVRFFGIPAGYEFATVIEDLLDLSTGTTDLLDETREALAGVTQDLHIQVFVTPT